jgi:hypothetical protein
LIQLFTYGINLSIYLVINKLFCHFGKTFFKLNPIQKHFKLLLFLIEISNLSIINIYLNRLRESRDTREYLINISSLSLSHLLSQIRIDFIFSFFIFSLLFFSPIFDFFSLDIFRRRFLLVKNNRLITTNDSIKGRLYNCGIIKYYNLTRGSLMSPLMFIQLHFFDIYHNLLFLFFAIFLVFVFLFFGFIRGLFFKLFFFIIFEELSEIYWLELLYKKLLEKRGHICRLS